MELQMASVQMFGVDNTSELKQGLAFLSGNVHICVAHTTTPLPEFNSESVRYWIVSVKEVALHDAIIWLKCYILAAKSIWGEIAEALLMLNHQNQLIDCNTGWRECLSSTKYTNTLDILHTFCILTVLSGNDCSCHWHNTIITVA